MPSVEVDLACRAYLDPPPPPTSSSAAAGDHHYISVHGGCGGVLPSGRRHSDEAQPWLAHREAFFADCDGSAREFLRRAGATMPPERAVELLVSALSELSRQVAETPAYTAAPELALHIYALGVVSPSPEDHRGEECSICLDGLDHRPGGRIVRTPCSHVYHRDCIVRWLRTSRLCPLCRFDITTTAS